MRLEKLEIYGYNVRLTKMFMELLETPQLSELNTLSLDGFSFLNLDPSEDFFVTYQQFLKMLKPSITHLTLNNFQQSTNLIPELKHLNFVHLNRLCLNNWNPTIHLFSSLFSFLNNLKNLSEISMQKLQVSKYIEKEEKTSFYERKEIYLYYEKKIRLAFTSFLNNSDSIKKIDLSYSNFVLDQQNHNSKRLEFRGNSILDVKLERFESLFGGKNKTLENLILDSCKFFTEDFIGLFTNFPSLKLLSLNKVTFDLPFSDKIPLQFPDGIRLNLQFMCTNFYPFLHDFKAIFLSPIKSLDLSNNINFFSHQEKIKQNDQFVDLLYSRHFISFLSSPLCNFQYFNLNNNNLQINKSFKLISTNLLKNKSLTSLDLSRNKISAHSASFISDLLKVHPSLLSLNLFCNKLDVNGCLFLSSALKEDIPLQFLDVGSNKIKNKGIGFITSSLSTNKNLKEISIRYFTFFIF